MDELLLYETLLDEARQPQHYGELATAELVLEGTNASCGDKVKIFVAFEAGPESAITHLSWTGEGCVISQAAMSVLAEHIISQQLTLAEVARLTVSDLENLIGVTNISTGRIKCLLLGAKTLGKAQ